ncbi:uncharacterized protein FMAN_14362 [Fusarium mangiferae]|uniref:DUF7053 domain-containing protein n=1 Tax=Fusarium mangiferae TaxID=192010 RepID=A0A1L7UIZ3_FUSMA|nr:uncharacterized protein FMAN_14362 [Fusarium mangiferae]CVL07441.1 uncharacterized protein FMAN_14362 [Fusarium mangiferae]
MRSQHHCFVNVPIPRHIPHQSVLDYIQTYEPVLRHNPGMRSWEKSGLDYALVANDRFFDSSDPGQSLCCYQAYEVMRLGPGVQRDLKWPIIFQRVPNGIVSRADAPAGVISWTQWYVRPRPSEAAADSVSTPSTATPSSSGDDNWEVYGIVTIEAHRMLMPWVATKSESYQVAIGQGMVDDACSKFSSGEIS